METLLSGWQMPLCMQMEHTYGSAKKLSGLLQASSKMIADLHELYVGILHVLDDEPASHKIF